MPRRLEGVTAVEAVGEWERAILPALQCEAGEAPTGRMGRDCPWPPV